MRKPDSILIVWKQFGAYHTDRSEAVGERLGHKYDIHFVEIATASTVYAWEKSSSAKSFQKKTLFPDGKYQDFSGFRVFFRLASEAIRVRPKFVFVANYNDGPIVGLSLLTRLIGARMIVMSCSKFDDKPRSLIRELLKRIWLLPYWGALVSANRSEDYFRWLGINSERIVHGYDSVSIERIRGQVDLAPAPHGTSYSDRYFVVVARFVEKKNLSVAIEAYARYRQETEKTGRQPRKLIMCGDGEKGEDLKEQVRSLDLEGVEFPGFCTAVEVSEYLSQGLCLLLPSIEEQWGLVVNEAMAWGLPILSSINCGANDVLVRPGINGYIYPPHEAEGLARMMLNMGGDEAEWRRLSEGSNRLAPLGDVREFVKAVETLVTAG